MTIRTMTAAVALRVAAALTPQVAEQKPAGAREPLEAMLAVT
jgi:hypothetical protein